MDLSPRAIGLLRSAAWASAVVFALLLGLTFFAQDHLRSLAKGFIDRKLEPPLTAAARSLVEQGGTLPEELRETAAYALLRADADAYLADPARWIAAFTAGVGSVAVRTDSAPARPVSASMAASMDLRVRAAQHLRRVFGRIVLDLRIFAGTNLAACLAALWLLAAGARQRVLAVHGLMALAAMAYGVSMYVRQDWFFTILFDWYMGWCYAALLAAAWLDLWRRHREGRLPLGLRDLAHRAAAG